MHFLRQIQLILVYFCYTGSSLSVEENFNFIQQVPTQFSLMQLMNFVKRKNFEEFYLLRDSYKRICTEWDKERFMINEENLYKNVAGKIIDNSRIAKMLSAFCNTRKQKEIVIVTSDDCNTMEIKAYSYEFRKVGIGLQIFCPNTSFSGLVSLQNAMVGIISWISTVVVLLLPVEESNLFLDLAKSYGLQVDKRFTWFIVKEKTTKIPDNKFVCIHWINRESIERYMDNELSAIQSILGRDKSERNFNNILGTLNNISNQELQWRKSESENIHLRQVTCENIITVLKAVTLIQEPFVSEVQSAAPEDSRGNTYSDKTDCINSHPCKLPEYNNNQTTWRRTCCSGFVIQAFMLIAKEIGVKFELYGVKDQYWGGVTNGSWTGIVGDVYYGKADVGMQALTTNVQRLNVVDFPESLLLSYVSIVKRTDLEEINTINWKFASSLKRDVIIAIFLLFVACSAIMFLFEYLNYFALRKTYYPSRETFSYAGGIVFQRDLGGKNPNKLSARIVAICFATAMTVIMTTYTANLTATNLQNHTKDNFDGLDDAKVLNPSSSFTYSVIKDSVYELLFRENEKFKSAYNFVKDRLLTGNYSSMLEMIRVRKLDGFIADYLALSSLMSYPKYCWSLTIYKQESLLNLQGIIVPKHSVWSDAISRSIFKLREEGTLDAMIQQWFFLLECLQEKNDAQRFPWQFVGGLLVVLGCCVVLSMVVLISEIIYTSYKIRMRKDYAAEIHIKTETCMERTTSRLDERTEE